MLLPGFKLQYTTIYPGVGCNIHAAFYRNTPLIGEDDILDAKLLFSTYSLDDVLVMRFLAAFIVKALPIKRHFCKLRPMVLLM